MILCKHLGFIVAKKDKFLKLILQQLNIYFDELFQFIHGLDFDPAVLKVLDPASDSGFYDLPVLLQP
ncbi:hypothetical protein DQX05_25305 [Paenibacillus thiaminolyticus]|uniref:Uncharacterized protein n=1 Tax=Paenibacillus thiaminolyticus TaxID=49283 RepID=A0A3A3GT40_PANTH|nr:hypothetical protein DQX05_25305 [Paenibacillus thiaminolyticus]